MHPGTNTLVRGFICKGYLLLDACEQTEHFLHFSVEILELNKNVMKEHTKYFKAVFDGAKKKLRKVRLSIVKLV